MIRVTVCFFLFFIISCSNRTAVPNDIIPPDSMEKIMKDVMMADQYAAQYISKDSLKRDKIKAGQDLMEVIFQIHHTTRAEFKTSLDFYESRPDLNKNMFDSLSADAARHRPELYFPKQPIKTHGPLKSAS